jgi:hypothetical protein
VLAYVLIPSHVVIGKRLIDGIPPLLPNLSNSPPSVPSSAQHSECEAIHNTFKYMNIGPSIESASNAAWNGFRRLENGSEVCFYQTEADVVHVVRNFIESVITALQLDLQIGAEIGIQHIRPDICALTIENLLVGVVEVKKPGDDILKQPTVLGELYDQMMLVAGFYGTGPVCGILTTGAEWVVAWFPEDDDYFSSDIVDAGSTGSAGLATPTKSGSELKRNSPPGNTPSQQKGEDGLHTIIDQGGAEEDTGTEEFVPPGGGSRTRQLSTWSMTCPEGESASQLLGGVCTALTRMAAARRGCYRGGPSRCLFKLHKEVQSITWHPASYDESIGRVNFDQYPRSTTKTLLALEDLGRGSSGKAWLCATTSMTSAVCVLKYHNKQDNSRLEREKVYWGSIYPEFKQQVSVDMWSGSLALMMPHFATIQEDHRLRYKDDIENLLREKFVAKSLVHTDVRWRNIGCYENAKRERTVVLYDLDGVQEYNVEKHADWVEIALKSLFSDGDEAVL